MILNSLTLQNTRANNQSTHTSRRCRYEWLCLHRAVLVKRLCSRNLSFNIYRGGVERIFLFSPSVGIGKTGEPVKTHQSDDMKANQQDKDKLYFNHYDPADLEHIIDTQHKVIELMKASNRKSCSLS